MTDGKPGHSLLFRIKCKVLHADNFVEFKRFKPSAAIVRTTRTLPTCPYPPAQHCVWEQVREEGQFQIQSVQQQLQQARDDTERALQLADKADTSRTQQVSLLTQPFTSPLHCTLSRQFILNSCPCTARRDCSTLQSNQCHIAN